MDLSKVIAEALQNERETVTFHAWGTFSLTNWPAEASASVSARLQALLALLLGRFQVSCREAEEFILKVLGAKAKICLGSVRNL